MKKTFSTKKSAFSLIELSIVLIIIGLLIAGITGGASLIKSSELRSVMGEARGYSVAVNGFYSQYNYLPGDYAVGVGGAIASSTTTVAYPGSTASGQNGRIEYNTGSVATYLSESVAAWDQLRKTGTIDSTTSVVLAATTTAQIAGVHMPASKIKAAGWHFDYRTNVGATGTDYSSGANEGSAATPAYQNVVVLTGTTTAASATLATAVASTLVNGATNLATPALTGPDTMSIDIKIDDSYANSGKVRGLNTGDSSKQLCYTLSQVANSAYNVASSTSKNCALTFQIDVNS